jgi:hypothetical protein
MHVFNVNIGKRQKNKNYGYSLASFSQRYKTKPRRIDKCNRNLLEISTIS